MCETARLALVTARRGRDEARLRELEGSYNIRDMTETLLLDTTSWAHAHQLRADVRRWEARCTAAEIALAECLEKRRTAQLRRDRGADVSFTHIV